jgi:WD40 repeat protein
MLAEDNLGDITLYEVENDTPINPSKHLESNDYELEWLGEGLRTYSKLKGVRAQYNDNNKITQIRKVLGQPIIIVCDEVGSIRLFNYPNTSRELYYNYYSEHLYQVTECVVSPDRKFFITICEVDRSIF